LATKDLYGKYFHIVMLFLAFFGIILTERPEIIAWPILHFKSEPSNIVVSIVAVLIWHIAIWCWISVHRNGVRGGRFWDHSRSLPVGDAERRFVDAVILSLCLIGFWGILGYVAYHASVSAYPSGVDGLFGFYFLGFIFLTLSFSKIAAYHHVKKIYFLHLMASMILIMSPGAVGHQFQLGLLSIFFLLLIYRIVQAEIKPRQDSIASSSYFLLSIFFASNIYVYLSFIQVRCLLKESHAFLPRMGIACLLNLLFYWLATLPNRSSNEKIAFLHISFVATCGLASGLYAVLHGARVQIEPWLGTTPFGRLRWKFCEGIVVCSIVLFIFLFLSILYFRALDFSWQYLLQTSMFYLLAMPVLGIDYITRNRNSVILKFCILAPVLAFKMDIA